ncbi:MAG: hypothetical protein Q8K32_05740 [Archangium sp.]|nr:hypothetical protein [Archangium sp.]
MTTWLLLPDAWRVELMSAPHHRDAWLSALDVWPDVKLVDWGSSRPAPGDLVLIAGLDFAAAELVLKLPPEVRVAATRTSWSPWLAGSRKRFLARAEARVSARLETVPSGRALPAVPAAFLGALMKAAEALS